MEEKRFALLIDAENTSAKYIGTIIDELKKCGIITYQRMYGDFSNNALSDWNKRTLEYAIVPVMQPRYSTAKNAADIMLVIDAMDILYQNKVEGFCIVSADSDFTRLASRLRESGMYVIGMGNSKASKAFIAVCNEYKFLDKIAEEDIEKDVETDNEKDLKSNSTKIEENEYKSNDERADSKEAESSELNDELKEKSSITPLNKIKVEINNIIHANENIGSYTHLGALKNSLQKKYSDFDERNYGYNSMKKFIQEATKFKVIQEGNVAIVARDNDSSVQIKNLSNIVETYIRQLASAGQGIELGSLGMKIKAKYPLFKYKDLGYSRLSAYVKSIEGLTVSKKNRVTRSQR